MGASLRQCSQRDPLGLRGLPQQPVLFHFRLPLEWAALSSPTRASPTASPTAFRCSSSPSRSPPPDRLGAQDVNGVVTHLFNPYSLQWNVTAGTAGGRPTAFRVSYIGTRSVNLLYRRNFNQPLPSTLPFDNNRRPYPQYRNTNAGSTTAASSRATTPCRARRSASWPADCTSRLAGPGRASGRRN